MALVSWKSFQFFEASQVRLPEDDGSLALDQGNVSAISAGSSTIFVGTPDGHIHSLDQTFKAAKSWRAHDAGSVVVIRQVAASSHLISIAETLSSEPQLRVWALDQQDRKTNAPRCLCTLTIKNALKSFPVTSFAVTQDLTQVAVGFGNGTVTVIRGDFIHEKGTKQRTVFESEEPITGLEFREAANTALYIGTTARILALAISGKGQGTPARTLAETGCAVGCMTLDPASNEIIVARDDAIISYGPRGKAASYPYEGAKKFVDITSDYVLVVAPKNRPSNARTIQLPAFGSAIANELLHTSTFTILNTDLKVIACSESLSVDVNHVLSIWGDIFLLSIDGKLYRYHEKTFQQKLDLLYERDLYLLAISMARRYKADTKQQNIIFRKYGDYLYKRGDFDTAMQQYLTAIDNTEPSQIIRQFLDNQRIQNLIEYLEELHEHEKANADHTTLLLNCYAKLKDVDKLETFIKQPGDLKFDLDTAILMCRQAGYNDQAAYLARRHNEHGLVVDILIEDLKRYAEALAYIQRLPAAEAYESMTKFGTVLLEHCPIGTTELFIAYFTGTFRPKKDTVIVQDAPVSREAGGLTNIATSAVQNLAALIPLPYMSAISATENGIGDNKAQPQVIETTDSGEFVPYTVPKPRIAFSAFIDHDDEFVSFLEACIKSPEISKDDKVDLHTTLFQIYLHKASNSIAEEKTEYERKARALVEDKEINLDTSNVLLLSDLERFRDGTILIHERQGLLSDVFRSYTTAKDTRAAIRALRKYGPEMPSLYPAALAYFTSSTQVLEEAGDEVEVVLKKIDEEGLMAPLQVIQTLSQNSVATMGLVKKYLSITVERERAEIAANRRLIDSYRKDTMQKSSEIEDLDSKPTSFSATRCSSCSKPLDLPTVHFLCKHSYHQHCLNVSPGQEENAEVECPICASQNETVKVIRRAQLDSASRHDLFADALARSSDRFGTISDWFGRGVMDVKQRVS
ncbi:hypothetical protein AMS68_005209 [Peltaster fructicola]|uniref:E3 ubiquitin-protein ligase PEP5 n=1 Tax=Peltaster fructicola TaxID=286661 RepID=A0A6H0XY46_9PEZI|nr:hypothetical protein AMS68_005209 [Peltaster fructicola]